MTMQKIRLKQLIGWVVDRHIPEFSITQQNRNHLIEALTEQLDSAVRDLSSEYKDKCRDQVKRHMAIDKKSKQYVALRMACRIVGRRHTRAIARLKEKQKVLIGMDPEKHPMPPPSIPITFDRFDTTIPSVSGIYFGWINGSVAYVGKSINLRARICETHSALRHCEGISWILVPEESLNWAECLYIGVLHPWLNFGGYNEVESKATAVSN